MLAECGHDDAWYDDMHVLIRRFDEFWPTAAQTPEERLNALVRLVAYCTLGFLAYKRDLKYVLFGLTAILVVTLVYRHVAEAEVVAEAREPTRRVRRTSRPPAFGGLPPSTRAPLRRRCTPSSPSNPFANMLLSDLAANPARAPACKYDEHKDLIRKNFNEGLVRNEYDVFEKENSQRQFMTMPVTTATADTIAFAQYCYGNAGRATCKEEPSRCTGAFP